jgi:CspA family cold shock protein
MPTGQVKFFCEKGYGFIKPDAPGDDVFIHATALQKANPPIKILQEGDHIAYELESGRNGRPAAGKIRLLPKRS